MKTYLALLLGILCPMASVVPASPQARKPAESWQLRGNSGTSVDLHFVGTTDNQPLELRVNGQRALRLEPNEAAGPNVIGGAALNYAAPGITGATIGGGGAQNFIGSAASNCVMSDFATIGGGANNWIDRYALGSTVNGGAANRIGWQAQFGSVAGGVGNHVGENSSYSSVGGGADNIIASEASHATVGGGAGNFIAGSGGGSTIGGGAYNIVQEAASLGTVSGGQGNAIGVGTTGATVGGGFENRVGRQAEHSVIGGGAQNQIGDNATNATVGGGFNNNSSGTFATVGGGGDNVASGFGAVVAGGGGIHFSDGHEPRGNTAGGDWSTVGGGADNMAAGAFSVIGGGEFNRASGRYAAVPGGLDCEASGQLSFAAGWSAKALHDGSFVWADTSPTVGGPPFASTANNQFSARAAGGIRFFSDAAASTGVELAPGSGSWSSLSDRNAKEHLAPANAREVLARVAALPLATWNYKTQDRSIRHLGPMAQDFHAAFGLGESDRTISSVDADGVALAAIQGLNQKLEEKDAQIQALQRSVAELKQLVGRLAVQQDQRAR